MPRVEVPVTPAVVEWAIEESGYSEAQVAAHLNVDLEDVEGWTKGTSRPTLTVCRKLATMLHRQLATFLLPERPEAVRPKIAFRDISGKDTRSLLPVERRYLRRAMRQQETIAWLSSELGESPVRLPHYSFDKSPEEAGSEFRALLKIPDASQRNWKSASVAFDSWRDSLERLRIVIFVFSMGEDACNGFSLWHDRAPLIAVSSKWNEEARIFSLMHELGHLLTRSDSACAERRSVRVRPKEPAERWCERFAAATLLPRDLVRSIVGPNVHKVRDLPTAIQLARRARISITAAVIRLIELGLAGWDLYDEIPPSSDAKPEQGGGGGGGRNRLTIRTDEIGSRAADVYTRAVRKDIISQSQAASFLDIPEASFDQLHGTRSGE